MRPKRIVYIQYTNPAGYPPLEHSSRILANDGWEVLFLGTGALGADKFRFPQHERIRVLQLPFQRAGWKQKVHFLQFHLWCFAWMLRWRPSWVYLSEIFSCPSFWSARIAGARIIFHEHDSPDTKPKGRFAAMLLRVRSHCARRASLCVIPSAGRSDDFVASTAVTRPPTVVWNCPRQEEIGPRRERLNGDCLRLLYHGSIVPERLPLSVIEALSQLPARVTLTVVGYETVGTLGYVKSLKERATALGIAERLNVVGTLEDRNQLISVCRNHDVGLTLMPGSSGDLNLRTMAGASNKAFDYLACGLALIVSRLPDWEEMFVKPGYGLACDPASAGSLAAGISFFVQNPEETRAMGERGRQRILEDWNYEYQFRPVREKLTGKNSDLSVELQPALEPFRSEATR